MVRITKRMKRLDLIASLINLLYIILALALVGFLFGIMQVPARESWVDAPHNHYVYNIIGNFTITQPQMNVIISLIVGFLIVAVPMTFKSFQRCFDKERIDVDEWSYRHQYLLSGFELVTLNPFSAGVRIFLGRHIQLKTVKYGIKEGIVRSAKGTWRAIVSTGIWLKESTIKLAKFIYQIILEVGRWVIVGYYAVLLGAKWLSRQIKYLALKVRYLFADKKSDKYLAYQEKLANEKEHFKKESAIRKEARITAKIERLEEIERKKNREERTQEDIDEANRKDVIIKIARLVFTYGTLTIVAIFIFVPFYWMVLTALKTYNQASLALNPSFFIGLSEMQWVNFKIALTEFSFLTFIGNTIFVGISTMIFTVLTTVLAAFAFSRLDFKGRDFIFSVLLMTMMVPGEIYTITNYITVSRLGWIDTFYAMIVPFSASVFYIFFLRQTFRQIPDSLYRAARVDGCSDFKYLTRVMIPIAAPTIITIIILSSIGAWDAYIWPQLVGKTDATTLVSVALRREGFNVGTGSDARPMYNMQLAATTVVSLPLIIIFFSLKKYILAGVGRSGTKG